LQVRETTELFTLEGKTAIVTGASQGLGVVFAEALARAGADVVVAARNMERLEAARARIEGYGRRCIAVRCDVTRRAEVQELMRQAAATFGRIDILVNNAGATSVPGIRAEYEDESVWREVIEVNLSGLWFCCQEAAQYMLRQGGGSIINISSIFGEGGFPGGSPAAYFASKGGVNNLTAYLATVWGDRGVRVNAIAPTFTVAEEAIPALVDAGVYQMLVNRHPMGRLAKFEDLTGPIVFLASDAAQFITGIVLRVDGGYGASRGFHEGPYPPDDWDPAGRGRPLGPDTPMPGR
jgi:NAD(P)-dependent dehydrogenase (short-subunit alcohol dehydrogenase family)